MYHAVSQVPQHLNIPLDFVDFIVLEVVEYAALHVLSGLEFAQ